MRARWLLAQTEAQLNACYQLRAYAFGRTTVHRPHRDRFDFETLPDGRPQSCIFEIKRYGMTVGTARLTIAAHPQFDGIHSETAALLDSGDALAAFVNARTLRWQSHLPVVAEIGCVGISDGANRDGAILQQIYHAIADTVRTRQIDVLLWTLTPEAAAHINADGLAFMPVPDAAFTRTPQMLRHMARHYDLFLPDLPGRLPEIACDPFIVDEIDDTTLREITSGCGDGAHVYWMDAAQFVATLEGAAIPARAV